MEQRPDGTTRLVLNALKLWQVKEVSAANVDQGKRFAERWCAARILPGVPLRDAVNVILGQCRPPVQQTEGGADPLD